MNESKFLGICIVVSSVILAGAIAFHAKKDPVATKQSKSKSAESQIGRYQFQPSNPPGVIWIIDTTTGKVTSR